jgi:hypothetical protein
MTVPGVTARRCGFVRRHCLDALVEEEAESDDGRTA